MATVTALRATATRVAVDLDGGPWRTLPLDVAAEARLAIGVELDRERARALARALRRHRAREAALRALSRRDHSRASLDSRLARAGVAPSERREALDRAVRYGLVDDARFAESRAHMLGARGAGDLMIVDDLVRNGVAEPVARAALALIEPEAERAARMVERRGASVKTVRYLASRGFSEETLEALVADVQRRALR